MIFKSSLEDRLESWKTLRRKANNSQYPLQDICDYWHLAPFSPLNHNINPYHKEKWPCPWQIIADNIYDDFTKALMIAYTIKLLERYNDSSVKLKILLDKHKKIEYNLVFVDDISVLNYSDNGPINADNLPDSFILQNTIEVECPR